MFFSLDYKLLMDKTTRFAVKALDFSLTVTLKAHFQPVHNVGFSKLANSLRT